MGNVKFCALLLFLSAALFLMSSKPIAASEEMENFLSAHVSLREKDRKISIPEEVRHIKLDIGLSYNAPMAQRWLSEEEDLFVFGFEPNLDSVSAIFMGAVKKEPYHGDPLDVAYIGSRFFLLPCALGQSADPKVRLYVTKKDCGCSSLYEPVDFEIEKVVEVPRFRLSDFFDSFPFDTHPVIDYIKIDAQGSDLDIVKSAGDYLSERVVFVTLEAENRQYKGTDNSEEEINHTMQSLGFFRYSSTDVDDPTYVNVRFLDASKSIKIFQKG